MMDIGSNIKKLRELKGYSQEYLASELGISQKQYSNFETGQCELQMNRFLEICTILDIDPSTVFQFDTNKFINQNCSFQDSSSGIQINHDAQKDKFIEHLQKEIEFLRKLLQE